MIIEQLYTLCLSESAYYIESNNEVAIIDPLRDVDAYIEMAKKSGSTIKYIFETHFHADFVSGHLELAHKTGAKIIYGPLAEASFDYHSAIDREVFELGDISLTLLHTPGHTMESSCLLLKDVAGKDYCVFTGDTLFVGDVGRPDLAVKSGDITQEDLAGCLFDSLRNHLMPLADNVIVYPAHGAGSSCGKNIGSETFSTIGEQKATNYALQPISKATFINQVTDGLLAPPSYFFTDVMMNKKGGVQLDEIFSSNLNSLSFDQVKKYFADQVTLLDTRNSVSFAQGFIKGSINIGLDGQYAPWVGALIDSEKPLVLICEIGKEKEAVMRLARVGYENVLGYLEGGVAAWQEDLSAVNNITSKEISKTLNENRHKVLDVRRPVEVENRHVLGSQAIRLQHLPQNLDDLDNSKPIIVYCAGGYRSIIACSILSANGFENITNIKEGFDELINHDVPLSTCVNACNN